MAGSFGEVVHAVEGTGRAGVGLASCEHGRDEVVYGEGFGRDDASSSSCCSC